MTQGYGSVPQRIGKTTGTFNTPVPRRPLVPPAVSQRPADMTASGLLQRKVTLPLRK